MDEKKGNLIEEKEGESLATEMLRELKKNLKRMFILLIISWIFYVATNIVWIYVFQSYDYVSEEYSQDGNGNNNINTGSGNINNEVKSSHAPGVD